MTPGAETGGSTEGAARVGVITVARSDYSILRPLLWRLQADPRFELRLFATGMHLSHEFGETYHVILQDGFDLAERVETLVSSDTPQGVGKSVGLGVLGFAQCFARERLDYLVLMGDRFEMLAPAVAALPFDVKIAHIHGGELTRAAFDDSIRHAITKMAHLHFTSTEAARRRVIQMGEQPDAVIRSGAPALDQISAGRRLSAAELEARFAIRLDPAPLLCTYHPETLALDRVEADVRALLGGLRDFGRPVVFTAPNADPSGRLVRRLIERHIEESESAWMVENFGPDAYYSALGLVSAMVGNSSSGVIEAASFGLPVVNVGNRQLDRETGENVVHVAASKDEIVAALRTVSAPPFRSGLRGMSNIYGDGSACEKILETLAARAGEDLRQKRFHDMVQAQ